ncbi:MAG TPA: 30S ribosomal protein S6, partial [bacterium]|nr:30S ribosomal protein S6 [bacterium]
LAYRIQKQKYGSYVLLEFGAEGSLVRELEENQRLNDAVLNYLTVRLETEPDLSEKRKRMEQEKEEYDEYEDHEEDEEEAEEAAEEQS